MLAQEAWTTGNTIAVIGVAVGIAGIVAGYFFANPRRRLYYGMPRVTRLLAQHGVKNLEVRISGEALQDPHLVEVRLITRGRRDIPSESFDRDEPLRIDLGVRILELVKKPPEGTTPPPRVNIKGTLLEVGPDLIGRRSELTYTLLVDGTPGLKATGRLVDVQMLRFAGDSIRVTLPFEMWFLAGMPLMAAAAIRYSTDVLGPFMLRLIAILTVVGITLLAAVAYLWIYMWRRSRS